MASAEVTVAESAPEVSELENAIKADLVKFDANAQEVRLGITTLSQLQVTNTVEREYAYQITKAANRSKLLIETRRKGVVAPYNARVKAINEYAKTMLVEPLEKAISEADAKILTFDKAEAKRREEEEARLERERLRIAEEAAQKQKELDAQKEAGIAQAAGGFEAEQARINAMPPGILKIKAQRELNAAKQAALAKVEETTAQAKQEASIDRSLALADVKNKQEDLAAEKDKGKVLAWKWELTDITKVPEIYKTIAEKLVNEAVRGGARDIPGIRIFSEEKLRH